MNTSHQSRPSGRKPRRAFSKKGFRKSSGRKQFRGRSRSKQTPRRSSKKMNSFDPSQFINRHPVQLEQEIYSPTNAFNSFGLDEQLVHNIERLGLVTPTPIQDQSIADTLRGRDIIGLAETGTGKTAAFLIPLIQNTTKNTKQQTLILAPTRELALQIDDEFRKLSRGLKLYSVVCVGGVNIRPQMRSLRQFNHFIIGTPGRVLDLINRKSFNPANVTTVVLDEADRMLDMGFIHDMRKILVDIPKTKQTLLFSATMSQETNKLVQDFLHDPVTVSVKKKDVVGSIEQDVVPFHVANKFETLVNLLKDEDLKRVLVFGSMKHSVERLSNQLTKQGIRAESIHGNKSHGARQQALRKFKSGNARVLVATDVAARGIHVENVSHVINYDLPNSREDYIHRIGRTGRAHKSGKALTFILQK